MLKKFYIKATSHGIPGLLGYAIFLICISLLIYYWFEALIHWLGPIIGILVGLFALPCSLLLVIVYWIVEGKFVWLYLLLPVWAFAGLGIGAFLIYLFDKSRAKSQS